MTADRLPVAAIKAQLLQRVPEIVSRLVPHARSKGRCWQAPNPTRAETSATSFTVWENGSWKEYDDDAAKGDVIDLIAYCLRCDRAGAIGWAKDFLGLKDMTPAERAAMAERAKIEADKRQKEADAEKDRKRRAAFDIWLGAPPIGAGTAPHLYLRDARAIDFFRVPNRVEGEGRGVNALRHWVEKVDAPAMVWPVRTLGVVTGVHCTFLEYRKGGWNKLACSSPRLMLGDVKGGVVYITHGPTGLAPREAAQAGQKSPLIVCEGIETGLSLALAVPEARVWAALSLGNVAEAPVTHPCHSDVFVALENDIKPTAVAMRERVLDTLARRLGRMPGLMTPPHGTDFNDTLKDD